MTLSLTMTFLFERLMKRFWWVFLLAGCASYEEQKAPVEVFYEKRYNPYHTVKEDETLQDVATFYKMNIDELAKLNNIKPDRPLVAGRRLLVHVRPESSPLQEDLHVEPSLESEDTAINSEQNIDSVTSSFENEFLWPLEGKKLLKFSDVKGVNIKAPSGTLVKSASRGTVRDVGLDLVPSLGRMVVIEYPGKPDKVQYVFVYAHLLEYSVKKGDFVEKGQTIGRVGKTGSVKTDQLFFQVRNESMKPIDPNSLIQERNPLS